MKWTALAFRRKRAFKAPAVSTISPLPHKHHLMIAGDVAMSKHHAKISIVSSSCHLRTLSSRIITIFAAVAAAAGVFRNA